MSSSGGKEYEVPVKGNDGVNRVLLDCGSACCCCPGVVPSADMNVDWDRDVNGAEPGGGSGSASGHPVGQVGNDMDYEQDLGRGMLSEQAETVPGDRIQDKEVAWVEDIPVKISK